MLRFFLQIFIYWYAFVSSAETIHVEKNFNNKEVVELITGDTKSEDHELLEYYLHEMFTTVPYLQIVPIHDETSQGKTVDTFLPNFTKMEELGHNYAVYYTMTKSNSSTIFSYVIFDGLYQNTIASNTYNTNTNIKTLATNIAHDIYLTLTGEFGFFIGNLFYTARSQNSGYQVLYSQDSNLKKTQYTNENDMITSPSYCNNGAQVFFAKKSQNDMNIHQMITETGQSRQITAPDIDSPYLASPEVSQDCTKVFISSIKDNGSDILMYNLKNRTFSTVISDNNINVHPILNEESAQIYYISDKIHPTKIWTKFLDVSGTSYLVSRGLGGYIYLALSHDKAKIAFVKILNNQFYLGTMNTDGSDEIALKTGYIIEAPSWAPFGNNIIVAIQDDRNGPRKIYSISSKTGYSYPIRTVDRNVVQVNWIVNKNDFISQINYHQ